MSIYLFNRRDRLDSCPKENFFTTSLHWPSQNQKILSSPNFSSDMSAQFFSLIPQGRVVCESNCAFCQGIEGGRPVANEVLFNIDRSDESDGYFYWKLAEGVEGTAMSAYKDSLSEEEMWQVISYIRSLGAT